MDTNNEMEPPWMTSPESTVLTGIKKHPTGPTASAGSLKTPTTPVGKPTASAGSLKTPTTPVGKPTASAGSLKHPTTPVGKNSAASAGYQNKPTATAGEHISSTISSPEVKVICPLGHPKLMPSGSELTTVKETLPQIAVFGQYPYDIELFSGRGKQDFPRWIRRFRYVMTARYPNLTDEQKKLQLVAHLANPARDEIEHVEEDQKNYEGYVRFLENHFANPEARNKAKTKLRQAKQGDNESVDDFADRIASLISVVMRNDTRAMQDERFIEEFCDKLRPLLAFHVQVGCPKTKQEVLTRAKTLESLLPTSSQDTEISIIGVPEDAEVPEDPLAEAYRIIEDLQAQLAELQHTSRTLQTQNTGLNNQGIGDMDEYD